jgi:hypothetical protein
MAFFLVGEKLRPEANRVFQAVHVKTLGHDQVARLMAGHQDPKHQNENEDG